MYWNEEIETMPREDLEELQLKKLQETVKRAFNKIPYYNQKYSEAEVYPEDIETLKDIEKLPFITKDDLRKAIPSDFLRWTSRTSRNFIPHQALQANRSYPDILKRTLIHGLKQ